MIDVHEPVPDTSDHEPVDPPEIANDGSVWAFARQAHDELTQAQADRKPLEIDVGDKGIVIRFKWIALADTQKSMRGLAKIRDETEQGRLAAIDTLILACDELLVRLPGGLTPLGEPGRPVRFDHQLCAGMGWEPMKARAVVHKLFGGEKGEWALLDAAQEVSTWIRGTGEDAAEDFATG